MAVTGAHNRAFPRARVGSRVIGKSLRFYNYCKGLMKPTYFTSGQLLTVEFAAAA